MEYELKVARLKTGRAVRSSSRHEMMVAWTRLLALETEHSWAAGGMWKLERAGPILH